MKTKTQKVVSAVEGWIVDQELPRRPGLKVLRPNHPDHGLSDDEIEERSEFITWHLRQEVALLNVIPTPELDTGFFVAEAEVSDTEYSAFNTHDFQRLRQPFNWPAWVQEKQALKVKDLALLHSCLGTEEGRANTLARFKKLLQDEFQDKLEKLATQLHQASSKQDPNEVRSKIRRIQRQVRELSQVWANHAWAP